MNKSDDDISFTAPMLAGDVVETPAPILPSPAPPPPVSSSAAKNPKKSGKRPRETEYLLDWSRCADMSSWAEAKVSAAREARRLKQKRVREDERCSIKLFSSLDVNERGEFLDELGRDDLMLRKLSGSSSDTTSNSELDMDEL